MHICLILLDHLLVESRYHVVRKSKQSMERNYGSQHIAPDDIPANGQYQLASRVRWLP